MVFKVNVLLSTYNGEKYVKELVESVLKQKGVEVILTVRDDGSSDRTIDIIKEFDDSRIHFVESTENLKAAKSFLELVKCAEEADFYAYCDQDDVWYDEKLKIATNALSKYDPQKESLYMSTYDVVDENLRFLYKRDMEYEKQLKIETTILCRAPSGCTMVFNKKLKDLISKSSPNHVRMHDFWTLLIAQAIKAEIITEDISLIKYRIHGENTVGLEQKFTTRFRRLVNSALNNKNERMLQVKSLYDAYNGLFSDDVNELLLEVINYKVSMTNRINFLFDRRFRWNAYTNMLFFLSVIMGVF